MADDPPVPPITPSNPSATILSLLNPYPTNIVEATKQQEQYRRELAETRGALSKVQGQRQDITTRNLTAIDEAISGLKNSRTGTYGFDPAVSAAMAAGFLKSTPGQPSNFFNELGQAMGNAAPVISGLQSKDRDSFALLAELQRKRGEFEAEPLKEQQTELSAREKLESANLREAEKALARAPAGAVTPKDAEKNALARTKIKEDIIKRAQADADKATAGMMNGDTGKVLSITDKQKVQRYLALEAVRDHNRRTKEGEPDWIDPAQFAMTQPEIDEAVQLADRAVPSDKGEARDYAEYQRSLKSGETPLSKPEWEAQNAAHKATAVERAKEALQAESQLETVIASTATVREIAEKLLSHPGVHGITGNLQGSEHYPGVGNDQVSAIALYDQLKANEFLKAIPSMKGYGQLTEAEGKKLGASQNALVRRMSPDGFRAELQNMIALTNKMESRFREKLADKQRRAGTSGGPTPPQPGDIVKGYRFKGGDPSNPASWEKVQ